MSHTDIWTFKAASSKLEHFLKTYRISSVVSPIPLAIIQITRRPRTTWCMSNFVLTFVTSRNFLWQLLVEQGKHCDSHSDLILILRGWCYCTEDPGDSRNDSSCQTACLGDPTTLCGGETTEFNSVYGTGTGRWDSLLLEQYKDSERIINYNRWFKKQDQINQSCWSYCLRHSFLMSAPVPNLLVPLGSGFAWAWLEDWDWICG